MAVKRTAPISEGCFSPHRAGLTWRPGVFLDAVSRGNSGVPTVPSVAPHPACGGWNVILLAFLHDIGVPSF